MKTKFEIFESGCWFRKLEQDIKEYQEKFNVEIKNVVLIEHNTTKTIIGVVFENRSENEQ